MAVGKGTVASLALLAMLLHHRKQVPRAAFQLLFKARLALHKTGLWQVQLKDVFSTGEKGDRLSDELISFAHVVRLIFDVRLNSFEECLKGLDTFYKLRLYHPWTGLDKHSSAMVRVKPFGTPCHWVVAPEANMHDRVILYLHGGGYVAGTFDSYLGFLVRLSSQCKCPVFYVDYTLSPLKTLQEIQEEILSAYSYLTKEKEFEASKMVVAGDSAGGGLTLGFLQLLRDKGLEMPSAGVMVSPYIDLTLESKSMTSDTMDIFFQHISFFEFLRNAVVDSCGLAPTHPQVSYLSADFENLPPLYVCVGSSERLRDDSRGLVQKARDAGVDVNFEEEVFGVHNAPLFAFNVPEFKSGFSRLTNFIQSKL